MEPMMDDSRHRSERCKINRIFKKLIFVDQNVEKDYFRKNISIKSSK